MIETILNFVYQAMGSAWNLLLDSSVYILFGLMVSGAFRVLLNPGSVARHLSNGPVKSVIKSSLLGIPLPLCSCGVLPAAMSLKKQGASRGAATAFLISTPESGIDSIAISYALLDPIMTVARPICAFITATVAGIIENLFGKKETLKEAAPDLTCPVDACCDGTDCEPKEHSRHHSLFEKIRVGLKYAFTDLWADMAGWFFLGLLLAGLITGLIPQELLEGYLGGGIYSMLIMLALGIPIYICATASTPIAAALILKGVSPGAALVFLLAGPATNITSLTVIFGMLGKRSTLLYFAILSLLSLTFGLAVDSIYEALSLSPQASIGEAAALIPYWLKVGGAIVLILISIKPLGKRLLKHLGIQSKTGKVCLDATGKQEAITTKKADCLAPT